MNTRNPSKENKVSKISIESKADNSYQEEIQPHALHTDRFRDNLRRVSYQKLAVKMELTHN